MINKLLTIQQVADLLGVSTKTLRRWEAKGFITAQRTAGNQRRYTLNEARALKRQLSKSFTPRKTTAGATPTHNPPVNVSQALNSLDSLENQLRSTAASTASSTEAKPTSVTFGTSNSVGSYDSSRVYAKSPSLADEYNEADVKPESSHAFRTLNSFRSPISFKLKSISTTMGVLSLFVFSMMIVGASFLPALVANMSKDKSENTQPSTLSSEVLADSVKLKSLNGEIVFHIPAFFDKTVTIRADAFITGNATVSGTLTAPNIVYSVIPGQNISISGDPQNPTISTGPIVTSLGGQTGELVLEGGAGITVNDLEISLTNTSLTVEAGTGLGGGGKVELGSSITLTNEGVISLTGTTNQVSVSSSTGDVTLSLPQDIDTAASVEFANLDLSTSLTVLGTSAISGVATFTHEPTLAHTYAPWPTGTSNGEDASIYINPASSVADGNLLVAAVGGVAKFVVDAEGDIYGNNLILTGAVTQGSTVVNGDLTVTGNTILGDAATDTITFNARVASNIIPATDNTYDLGTSALRWKDIYVGPGSFNITSTTGTSGSGADYTLGQIAFTGTNLKLATSAVGSGAAGSLQLTTGSNTGINIDTNGLVGIGTTAPVYLLHTYKASGENTNTIETGDSSVAGLRMINSVAQWRVAIQNGDGGNDDFIIREVAPGTGNRLTILNGGNVGIGTSTPTSFKLEIAGNVGPEADNTRNLGSAIRRWANIFGTTINATTINASGDITATGDLAVNGGDITTTSTTGNIFNTSATTVNIGGAAGAGGVNIAGGSGSTGCTVDGTTGNLTCTGDIVGSATGVSGFWTRTGTTLYPTNSGDHVTTLGNVGIGTTTPAAPFHILGGATVESIFERTGFFKLHLQSTSGEPEFWTEDTGSAGGHLILQSSVAGGVGIGGEPVGSSKLYLQGEGTSTGLAFFVEDSAGADRFSVLDNGNVGIGTTTPQSNLQISASTLPTLTFETIGTTSKARFGKFAVANSHWSNNLSFDGTNWNLDDTTATGDVLSVGGSIPFRFRHAAAGANPQTLLEYLAINSSGNVGIGTAAPSSFKLETVGSIGPSVDNIYDLGSAVRRWANIYGTNIFATTLTGTITPTGFTQGSVVFAGPGGTLTQDNANFFWDDTNNRLGIGTTAPGVKFNVVGDGSGSTIARFQQSSNPSNLVMLGVQNDDTASTSNTAALELRGNTDSTTRSFLRISASLTNTTDATRNSLVLFNTNNAGAFTTAMAINGGNVGIGTTAPSSALDVVGNIELSSLGTTNTATHLCYNSSNQIAGCNTTGTGAAFVQDGNSFGALATLGTNDAFGLAFETSGVERARIGTTGGLGIGTTTTTRELTFGAADAGIVMDTIDGADNKRLQLSGGGSTSVTRAAYINLYGNENAINPGYVNILAGYGGDITFIAQPSGATTERMRITSAGNVGIGTTAPGAKLQINTGADATVGQIIRANSVTQTADLLRIQDSAGTNLTRVTSAGYLFTQAVNAGGTIVPAVGQVRLGSAAPSIYFDRNNVTEWIFYQPSTTLFLRDATNARMQIAYVGGADSDLAQTHISSRLSVGHASAPAAQIDIRSAAAGTIGSIIRGATSQTADLQQWQNSLGTTLAAVNSAGNFSYVDGATNTATAVCKNAAGQLAPCNTTGTGAAFVQDGNSFGSLAMLGTNDAFGLAFETSGTEKIRIDTSGNVGIGTTAPGAALDISNGGLSLNLGADSSASTRTNSTNKFSRISSAHFTNAEEPVAIAVTTSGTSTSTVAFGGGSSLLNTATTLTFYTAANNTTLTGTERMRIDSAGNVGIGTTAPLSGLHLNTNTLAGSRIISQRNDGSGNVAALGLHTFGSTTNGQARAVLSVGNTDADLLAIMTLSFNGNVGIGTLTPNTFKLETAGSIGPSVDNTYDLGSTARRWANIYGTNVIANNISGAVTPTGFTQGSVAFAGVGGTLTQDNANFFWDDTNNRLGLGTTAPSVALHLSSDTTTEGFFDSYAASQAPQIAFRRARGTASVPSAVIANDLLGGISFRGHDGSAFSLHRGGLRGYAAEGWTSTAQGTYLALQTTPIGSTTVAERVRIDAAGNVGIGTTNPLALFAVGSTSQFQVNSSGQVTYVDGATNTATAVCKNAAGQLAPCNTTGTGAAFVQNGNSFGALATLGTNDAFGLAFETSGTEKMRILTNGNVGIGTTAPTAGLSIAVDNTKPALTLFRTDVTTAWTFQQSSAIAGLSSSNALNLFASTTAADFGIRTATSGNANFVVSSTGNVGIGTTSPLALFSVGSSSQFQVSSAGLVTYVDGTTNTATQVCKNSSGQLAPCNTTGTGAAFVQDGNTFGALATLGTNDAFGLAFETSGVEKMRILTDGNVGIGTTAPGAKLDVAGTLRTTATDSPNIFASFEESGGAGKIALQYSSSLAGIGSQGGFRFYTGITGNINQALGGNEVLRIESGGNVGIGTTSPGAKLAIEGSSAAAPGFEALRVTNTGAFDASYIAFPRAGDPTRGIIFGHQSAPTNNMSSVRASGSVSQSISIQTGLDASSVRGNLIINTLGGNVGIGNNATTALFSVGSTSQFQVSSAGLVTYVDGATDTATAVCKNAAGQLAPCNTTGTGAAFVQDGNSFGSLAMLGTNDAFGLAFETSGVEKMRILTDGNVGIGTTAPGAKLEIAGTNTATSSKGNLFIATTDAFGIDVGGQLSLGGKYNTAGSVLSFGSIAARKETAADGSASGYLAFGTSNAAGGAITEKLRITSSGNVGIGTTTPSSFKLEIAGSIGPTADNTYDLGSATRRWANVYANNINSTGSLTLTGSLLPAADDTYDLGSSSLRWRDLYLGPTSLHIQSTAAETTTARDWAWGIQETDGAAEGNLRLSLGGTDFMNVTPTGNVGIGTTSPSEKLRISGGASTSTVGIYGDVNTNSELYLTESSSLVGSLLRYDGAANKFHILTSAGSSWTGKERLSIDRDSGNVGIGTTGPGYKLNVKGASGDTALMRLDNSDYDGSATGTAIAFTTGAATGNTYGRLQVFNGGGSATGNLILQNSGGNVGIGTTGPAYTLDVWSGQMRATTIRGGGSDVGTNGNLYLHTSAGGTNVALSSSGVSYLNGGNVGIGTTAPLSKLDVYSGTTGPALRVGGTGTGTSNDASIDLYAANAGNVPTYARLGLGVSSSTLGSETGYMTFSTINSGTLAEKLRITAAGNVGIGTTAPGAKLDISGSSNYALRVVQTATSLSNNNYTAYIDSTSHTSNLTTAGAFAIDVNSGRALTVNGFGNVGIGTTTPSVKLQVNTDTASDGFLLYDGVSARNIAHLYRGSSSNDPGVLDLYNAGSVTIKLNGEANTSSYFNTGGNVGIGTTAPTKKFQVTDTYNAFIAGSGLGAGANFYSDTTVHYGSTVGSALFYTAGTEKMRIDTTGNVGIGTTAPSKNLVVSGTGAPGIIINTTDATGRSELMTYENDVLTGLFQWRGSTNATSPSTMRIGTAIAGGQTHLTYGNQSIGLALNSSGNVGIGTTTPFSKLELAGSLRLYEVATDNAILFQDQNIAHGLTGLLPETGGSSIHTRIKNADGTIGGTEILGVTDQDLGTGLRLYGVLGITDPTDTVPGVTINAAKKNTTNVQALGALETVLQVQNNATALMTVLGGGNVGIGTTAPTGKLDVRGIGYFGISDLSSILGRLVVQDSTATDGSSLSLTTNGNVGSSMLGINFIDRINATSQGAEGQIGSFIRSQRSGAGAGFRLLFGTNDGTDLAADAVTKMVIDTTGNVGIGTTAPGARLQVEESVAGDSNQIIVKNSNSTDSVGVASGIKFITSSSDVGRLYAPRNDATFYMEGILNRALGFRVPNGGSPITAMYIGATGNVGIGTTAPTSLLHLAAGTTTKAPLKLTAGTNLTTAEAGAIEFNGTDLFFTTSTPTRRTLCNDSGNCLTGGGAATLQSAYNAGNTILTTDAKDIEITLADTTTDQTFEITQAGSALAFRVNDDGTFTDTTPFAVAADGNVGIGTTVPTRGKLQIDKDSTYNSESTGGLYLLGGATDTGLILGADATNDVAYIQSVQQGTSFTTRPLALNPNGGNVGIGTTAPETNLHLFDTGTSTTIGQLDTNLRLQSNSVTVGAGSELSFRGTTLAATNVGTYAAISAPLLTNGATGSSGHLTFSTKTAAATTTLSERMRIDNTGNVGIGTTAPAQKLDITGGNIGLASGFGIVSPDNFFIGTSSTARRFLYSAGTYFGENGAGFHFKTGDASTGTERFTILAGGNVGIGTTAPGALLHVAQTSTAVSGTNTNTQSTLTANPGSAPLAGTSYRAGLFQGIITTGNAQDLSNVTLYGLMGQTSTGHTSTLTSALGASIALSANVAHINSGTITSALGISSIVNNTSTGTITNATGLSIASTLNSGGGTIGSNLGISVGAQTVGGNNAGIVIGEATGTNQSNLVIGQTTIPTGTYSIYNSSPDQNYFAGNVGIGTTAPDALLYVKGADGFSGVIKVGGGNNIVTALGEINSQLDFGSNDTSVTGGIGGRIASVTEFNNGAHTGLAFYTHQQGRATPLQEAMRIDNNGNVGIGTTAPSAKLEVYGVGQLTSALTDAGVRDNILALNSSSTTAGAGGGITFGNSQSVAAGSTGYAAIKGLLTNGGTNTTGDLAFSTRRAAADTAFTEAMRIQGTTGNVGIGTTAPGTKLEVAGYTTISGSSSHLAFSNPTTQQIYGPYGSTTTGGYSFNSDADTGFSRFAADTVGIVTAGAERLRVTSTGNVGIGTTAPGARLHIAGGDVTIDQPYAFTFANGQAIRDNGGGGLTLNVPTASATLGLTTNNGNILLTPGTGNVGIGTTAPGALLTVSKTGDSSNEPLHINSPDFATAGRTSVLTLGKAASSGNSAALGYRYDTVASGQLAFLGLYGDALGTGLVVQKGGNVGIGTTAPGAKLSLQTATANTTQILLGNSSNGTGDYQQIKFQHAQADTTYGSAIRAINKLTNVHGGNLAFLTDNTSGVLTERVRIDESGNVGIGTTGPGTLLELESANPIATLDWTNTANYGAVNFQESGVYRGAMQYIGSTFATTTRRNNLEIVNAIGGGAVSLWTNAIERVRVDGTSGNVGIGTTAPGALLDVDRADISSNSELIDIRSQGFTQTITSGLSNARFNQFNSSTITAASAQTVTNAATVYIAGAPIAAGSATITNNYGLWVDSGNARFDGNVGIGTTAPTRNLDVTGTWGGNVVVDNRTNTAAGTTTYTVSTKALAYYLTNDIGTTTNATTTEFDITGLPETDGTYAFIFLKVIKGVSGTVSNQGVVLKINGTILGNLTHSGNITAAETRGENYIIMRANGAWRIAGYGSTTSGTATIDNNDLAEWIPFTGERPVEGDVLTVGDTGRSVKKSTTSYDNKLMGVVTTNPGLTLGADDGNSVRLALSGRVPVKVASSSKAIQSGDYITSSDETGKAMKATRSGAVIGKALEPWTPNSGQETVMMLIDNSYADPNNTLATLNFDDNGNLILPFDEEAAITELGGTPPAPKKDLAWTLGNVVNRLSKLEEKVASGSATTFSATDSARLDILEDEVETNSSNIADLRSKDQELTTRIASLEANLALFASGSAMLAETPQASSAAELSLDTLDTKKAIISNTLSVGGRTTLSDVGVTGKMNIGLLAIDGLSENGFATLNTTSGPLMIQSDGINGVDILDGRVVIAANGDIKTEGEITAKKINIDTTLVAGASLGTTTILDGQTKITVDTTALTENSKIFVQAIDSPVATAVKRIDANSFEIRIALPQTTDLKLNWWIVN